MDITKGSIAEEFRRQVYLCQGIGEDEMLKIVDEFYRANSEPVFISGQQETPRNFQKPEGSTQTPEVKQ
jgi:hypothetical protein